MKNIESYKILGFYRFVQSGEKRKNFLSLGITQNSKIRSLSQQNINRNHLS